MLEQKVRIHQKTKNKFIFYLPSSGGLLTRAAIYSFLLFTLCHYLPSEMKSFFEPVFTLVHSVIFLATMILCPISLTLISFKGFYLPRRILIDLENNILIVKKWFFFSLTTFMGSIDGFQSVVFDKTIETYYDSNAHAHKYTLFICKLKLFNNEYATIYQHTNYQVVRKLVTELSRLLKLSIEDETPSLLSSVRRYKMIEQFNQSFLERNILNKIRTTIRY